MKFAIDIEDFWMDEENELEPALKAHITRSVVLEVSKSIEDKVQNHISEKVKIAIDEKLSPIIDNIITDVVATETITYNRSEISITQHVKNLFQNNMGWNASTQIKRLAENFGKELKAQYNAAFANQIVVNMKEQGLLKDEVVQILLDGK